MTKKQYLEKAFELLNSGKINEDVYDSMIINANSFVDEEVIYQVVFNQCDYESVDYETEDFDNACEVKFEMQNEMYACGERDFCYYIREVKKGI